MAGRGFHIAGRGFNGLGGAWKGLSQARKIGFRDEFGSASAALPRNIQIPGHLRKGEGFLD